MSNKFKIKRMFLFITVLMSLLATNISAYPIALQPDYAKWGRMAVLETQKRYPNAEIIDYLHIGRKQLSPSIAEERFKLWLRENTREFGVFVNIKFNINTDRVIEITFRETNR